MTYLLPREAPLLIRHNSFMSNTFSVVAGQTCYNSMQVSVKPFGISQIDFKESKTCTSGERCMLVSAEYLTQESIHSSKKRVLRLDNANLNTLTLSLHISFQLK